MNGEWSCSSPRQRGRGSKLGVDDDLLHLGAKSNARRANGGNSGSLVGDLRDLCLLIIAELVLECPAHLIELRNLVETKTNREKENDEC